ncbi:class I SAM-dependent methyltransferase [Holosporaceae bacterium 'Namur']|nr:class I SAM-dependent methyltransferase [Holosporaceae bacterium 'Namur']
MTDNGKIYGGNKEIEFNNIRNIYNSRAKAIDSPLHAVMLQGKESELPILRNEFEKNIIKDNLQFDNNSKILDLGCGAGRVAKILPDNISYYYGVDFSEELIKIAQNELKNNNNFFFVNTEVSQFQNSGEVIDKRFNTVFIIATMIYLNEPSIKAIFTNLLDYIEYKKPAQIYIRESISLLNNRISLDKFYSDKLETNYSSIYRTDGEYKELFKTFELAGFHLDKELLFPEQLGNNTETRQKSYILKRK